MLQEPSFDFHVCCWMSLLEKDTAKGVHNRVLRLRLILEQEKRIQTSKMAPHCKKWEFYHSLNTKNSSFESLNNVANVITLQYININININSMGVR